MLERLEASKPSTVNVNAGEAGDSHWVGPHLALSRLDRPLCLPFIESVCTGAMMLSGVRVALGFSSLLAAGAGWSGARLPWQLPSRIPMLWIAGLGASLNLLLLLE